MLKKYLEDALLFEEKGYKLYISLAAEAKNLLAQKLFESLATQEKYHMDYIKAYFSKTEFKKIEFDPLEIVIKNLFNNLDKKMLHKNLSQTTGIKEALQMEREGFNLYKKAYDFAKSQSDKDFFAYLLAMESEHYESLANLYYYYTSNDQWLSEQESKVWNWMNF